MVQDFLDSVNGRMIQAWAMMLLGIAGYSQYLNIPVEVTGLVFGFGMSILKDSLAAPNDGK